METPEPYHIHENSTHGVHGTAWMFNVTHFSNSSHNSSLETSLFEPHWSTLQNIVFSTWLSICTLCAIVGNIMVILVIAKHKGMRTRTNLFLVNLAIADVIVGLILAPFSLTTMISGIWIFGDVMCSINGFMNVISFTTSIHTMLYISIHKYVTIAYPFSRCLTRTRVFMMIGCTWLWAIVCGTLTVGVLNKVVYKPMTTQCGPEYPHNKAEYLHHVIIQVTNIILPLTIMTFAYGRVYCEIRQHYVRLRVNTSLPEDQIIRQQIKITKTLFLLLACFVICWLPYAGYSSYVSSLEDKSKIPVWANPLAYCCMYTNSVCNPFILYWRNRPFRAGFKGLLVCDASVTVSDASVGVSTVSNDSTRGILRDSVKGHSIKRENGNTVVYKDGKVISVRRPSVPVVDNRHADKQNKELERLCEATVQLLNPTTSHLEQQIHESIDNQPDNGVHSTSCAMFKNVSEQRLWYRNSVADDDGTGIAHNRVGTFTDMRNIRSHIWNDSLYGHRKKLTGDVSHEAVIVNRDGGESNSETLVQLLSVV